jgi:hypothetical protein
VFMRWLETPASIPVATAAIALAVAAIYSGTAGYGLFSDDFEWLLGASRFEPARLFDLSNRDHFYRPVLELYFPAAVSLCGRSTPCYHWLSIVLHLGTSGLVAGLAGSISGIRAVGAIAGLLFAVQPGPIEAVIWVSAVSELLATAFFVLTVWLFHAALAHGRRGRYALSVASFVACLLTHESGVTLLPVLVLALWLLPDAAQRSGARLRWPPARRLLLLAPFILAAVAYAVVAYIVNSRNYLVTEGQYGVGGHMIPNILGAVVTMAVGRRGMEGLVLVAVLCIWAAGWAPPRVRFFSLWMVVTLIPFAGFHGGLSSRYLYLPAVGFAGLAAELLWSARHVALRWPRAGPAVWWIVAIAVTVRFAAFAARNVHTWEGAAAPYLAYVASVRRLHPAPPKGARLEIPAPPEEIPPHYVPSLLRWELGDPDLMVVIREP